MTVVVDSLASRRGARREGGARLGRGFLWNSWDVAAVSGDLVPGRLVPRQILGLRLVLGRAAPDSVKRRQGTFVCHQRVANPT